MLSGCPTKIKKMCFEEKVALGGSANKGQRENSLESKIMQMSQSCWPVRVGFYKSLQVRRPITR